MTPHEYPEWLQREADAIAAARRAARRAEYRWSAAIALIVLLGAFGGIYAWARLFG